MCTRLPGSSRRRKIPKMPAPAPNRFDDISLKLTHLQFDQFGVSAKMHRRGTEGMPSGKCMFSMMKATGVASAGLRFVSLSSRDLQVSAAWLVLPGFFTA